MALPERLLRQSAVTLAREHVLAAIDPLQPLLPGGIRRGTVLVVEGSTTLALSVLAGPSGAGSWCAAVGMPSLGLVAAASIGIDLERFALVPDPGRAWPEVTAALIDALDVVLLGVPARAGDARRLTARARERGAVLVAAGAWPERCDVRLRATRSMWEGAGDGDGHLQRRTLEVVATGRGAASQERRAMVQI